MIIVLGCPSQKTMRLRSMVGANLAKKKMGTTLLIMGTPKQTAFMKDCLKHSPIMRRIMVEPNCTTTEEMALLSSSYIPKNENVTIVTSSNHIQRAKLLFEIRLKKTCTVESVDRSGVNDKHEIKREQKKIERIRILQTLFSS